MSASTEVINIAINISNKFLDSFLMLQIMYRCFNAKKPEVAKRALWIWIAVSTIFTYSMDLIVNMDFFSFLALYMLVGLSFGIVCMNGTIYMKVFVVLIFTSCSLLIRFITVGIIRLIYVSIGMQDALFTPAFSFFASLFSVVLCIALSIFLIKCSVRTSFSLPAQYCVGLIIIVATVFLSMIMIRNEPGLSTYLSTFIMFGVFIAILMLYFLFSRLTREYEEKHGYLLQSKVMELNSNHLDEITETYNNLRSLRHEMSNHVMYMDTLLQNKQYEKLSEYFKTLYHSELIVSNSIESGNNVVNAILNQKKSYAFSKGIQMHTQAFLPEHIAVKDYELCAVVSNLIDNAIEACDGIENPSVRVDISIIKNYISIVVRNPVSNNVLEKNPDLYTTKENRQNHGFGIKIIRNIVNQHDGMLTFEIHDGIFIASAMMKLEAIDSSVTFQNMIATE